MVRLMETETLRSIQIVVPEMIHHQWVEEPVPEEVVRQVLQEVEEDVLHQGEDNIRLCI